MNGFVSKAVLWAIALILATAMNLVQLELCKPRLVATDEPFCLMVGVDDVRVGINMQKFKQLLAFVEDIRNFHLIAR